MPCKFEELKNEFLIQREIGRCKIYFYNKIPLIGKKMNPDLVAYVTDKSLSGIYVEIATREKDIRANPAARTSALLQKVFTKK